MPATESPVYTAKVSVTGGREGHAISDDGRLDLSLTRPGAAGTGTNPEQLFAAGYAACFQSAMGSVARQRGVDVSKSVIESSVSLYRGEGSFYLGVTMRVSIPGLALDEIQDLVDAAHQVCPYSNATRGNIDVSFEVAN
ncbi:MAG TPA: organic hydroperoxide resistance protein [Thermomicrobiales bacterium]|nr:organic hydroperoxide resistance protein [Thermomicrobiales bacterium]